MPLADNEGDLPPNQAPEEEAEVDAKVSRLHGKGNTAYEAGRYEEAIEAYSKALRNGPKQTAALLSSRSAAFASLSRQLRGIPAAASEARAIYGLDPLSLAQLALKDADKLVSKCSTWTKAYLRKGTALRLLERYEDAREAFLEGLQIEPGHAALQGALKELHEEEGRSSPILGKRKQRSVQRTDDFDCTLCFKLLFEPVTISCGHSFCKQCLARALDHGHNKCPICRTVLFVSPQNCPLSVTLKNVLEKKFPEEYAERKAETEGEASTSSEVLPLFVMDIVLPTQKVALNIFEPRYRLMIRRVMEGNHKMGMIGYDHNTRSPADVGCEVEIVECEPLPDGRFYIEIEGRRRCKVTKSWEQDGYRVGEVEWMEDEKTESGSEQERQLQELTEEASTLATEWTTRAMEISRRRRGVPAELLRQTQSKPPTSDPERFSFWVANLLPLGAEERLGYLQSTSTIERLQSELTFLRNGGSGCRVQ